MKKHVKCLIIFMVVIIGWYLIIDITKALKGERLIFFERWRLSDMGYAKNIEIVGLMLTDEQTADLLANPQEEVSQPMQKDIYMKNVNIILRIKNRKKAYAWGTLGFRYDNNNWSYVDITLFRSEKKDSNLKYYNYVIPEGILIPFSNNIPPKNLEIKWKSLYTYR